ncbi:MAG: T9SS type A sorting domain-containing protein [Candidatus Eisenbacteria bacterium]
MKCPRTSFALLVVALSLVPGSVREASAAYAQADLAGTWRSQTLASGAGAPWWERGLAMITPGGLLTAYALDNHGHRDTTSGTVVLDANGVVTLATPAAFSGALDLGKTVLVATDTWPGDGTSELKLVVKTNGTAVTSDLAGAWELQSIASGPGGPWWMRGRLQIAANGSFTGTLTDNTGASDSAIGSMSVAPDGGVGLSVAPLALGWLDAGRSVLVLTNTWSDGTAELSTAVRMAPAYVQSDLAGTWQVRQLACGPGAPWWSRGQIVVAPNGSYSGSVTQSDGHTGPVSGSFTLGGNGVLTRSGSAAARGALDAGHTVMVWTDTWATGSPGTAELLVGVRTDGATTNVPPSAGAEFGLTLASPNPVRGGSLVVRCALGDSRPAQLELLDVAGRVIAAQDLGVPGEGTHAVTLPIGEHARPGVYFVRLRQAGSERVKRFTLLR